MDRPVAPISDDAAWVPSGWPEADLVPGELHVWRADLDRPIDLAPLSHTERERASRFHSETHRLRWSRSRALLRQIVGGYLDRDPGAIAFASTPNGKPAVEGGGELEFNLSHSGGLVVVALATGNPLGVDVERDRDVRDPLAIAGRVLGADQAERLRSLPETERRREFLRSWVRYEAALKCRGDRLGASADQTGLHLIDLDPEPGAAAAVALERAPNAALLRELSQDQPGAGSDQVKT
jgi:4'-phosphopantetheinyl transferase